MRIHPTFNRSAAILKIVLNMCMTGQKGRESPNCCERDRSSGRSDKGQAKEEGQKRCEGVFSYEKCLFSEILRFFGPSGRKIERLFRAINPLPKNYLFSTNYKACNGEHDRRVVIVQPIHKIWIFNWAYKIVPLKLYRHRRALSTLRWSGAPTSRGKTCRVLDLAKVAHRWKIYIRKCKKQRINLNFRASGSLFGSLKSVD